MEFGVFILAQQRGYHQSSQQVIGNAVQQTVAAEQAGFDLLLTTDKNIQFQQDLAKRVIAIVVLGNPQWLALQHHADRVVAAVNAARPGTYSEVQIPDR